MHDGSVLAVGIALTPGAVGSLGGDEMFYTIFMANEMDGDPIRQIEPLPSEAELANGRVLSEENALLPFR